MQNTLKLSSCEMHAPSARAAYKFESVSKMLDDRLSPWEEVMRSKGPPKSAGIGALTSHTCKPKVLIEYQNQMELASGASAGHIVMTQSGHSHSHAMDRTFHDLDHLFQTSAAHVPALFLQAREKASSA